MRKLVLLLVVATTLSLSGCSVGALVDGAGLGASAINSGVFRRRDGGDKPAPAPPKKTGAKGKTAAERLTATAKK
jgi:hypothetical protein